MILDLLEEADEADLPASIEIIARASGKPSVRPGEIVTCKVDLAMILDSGGPRKVWPRLKELGVGVWDPEKIVVVSDHFVPAVGLNVMMNN